MKNTRLFSISKPNRESVLAFVKDQAAKQFSYSEVGHSKLNAPTGYTIDHNRIKLGDGVNAFERAKAAIRAWKMFEMPWVNLCWPDAPIEVGTTVGVLVYHFGFWSANACRIVYLIDESGPTMKYGFGYGTLLGHREIGEERFTVEYGESDAAVYYDLYSFSRPGLLASLVYPFAGTLQRRFATESKQAMQRSVGNV